MLPVSLDCLFLTAYSIFPNVYKLHFSKQYVHIVYSDQRLLTCVWTLWKTVVNLPGVCSPTTFFCWNQIFHLERYLSLLRNCLSTEHILQDLIHVYLCATSMSWQETTDRLQTVVILINIVLLSLCHIGVLTETTDRLQTVVILIKSVLLSLCHISVLTGNHWQASNCGDINQHCFIIFVPHWCLNRKPLTGFKLWWY